MSSVRSSTPPPLGHLATSPSANLSPTRKSHYDEQSSNNATNFFTRNLSPSFIRRGKSSSISSMAEIGKASSFTDLMPSTSSPSPGDGHSNIIHFALAITFTTLNIHCQHRSLSHAMRHSEAHHII